MITKNLKKSQETYTTATPKSPLSERGRPVLQEKTRKLKVSQFQGSGTKMRKRAKNEYAYSTV